MLLASMSPSASIYARLNQRLTIFCQIKLDLETIEKLQLAVTVDSVKDAIEGHKGLKVFKVTVFVEFKMVVFPGERPGACEGKRHVACVSC